MLLGTHTVSLEAGVQVNILGAKFVQQTGDFELQIGIEEITVNKPGLIFGGDRGALILLDSEGQDIFVKSKGNTNITIGV